jgi:hypothetical protein
MRKIPPLKELKVEACAANELSKLINSRLLWLPCRGVCEKIITAAVCLGCFMKSAGAIRNNFAENLTGMRSCIFDEQRPRTFYKKPEHKAISNNKELNKTQSTN